MPTLLMKFSGPLQSWGTASRFTSRATDDVPSKSGVVGLLAAALGRGRTESVEDLAKLPMGSRTDQPGSLLRDFHTTFISGKKHPSVTNRYYLTDAVFVVGVEGPVAVIDELAEALRHPAFPLYLGRRSCPTNADLLLGVVDEDLDTALRSVEWQAAEHYRQKQTSAVNLDIMRDVRGGERGDLRADYPESFDSELRKYRVREVFQAKPHKVNVNGSQAQLPVHTIDFFDEADT